jgi:NLR family CARD domain-containing protein 3
LSGALKVNAGLRYLDLRCNNIGDEGAASWLDVLTKCNTKLTKLDLYGNDNISGTIRSAIASFIDANKAGIRQLHAEAELDLSSKDIGEVQAKRIASELLENTAVTMLVLNKNRIGRQGCVDIADALIKNRILRSIRLDYNSIDNAGCLAIAAALKENMVLTKLSLNGNRIGPAGAAALAETLRMNSILRELGLGQNNVGNDGVASIADALRRNEALERLDLSGNRISDKVPQLFSRHCERATVR